VALAAGAQIVEARLARLERTDQGTAAAIVVPALIADLPEFAVAQDIDANVVLALDHLLDANLGQLVEALLVSVTAGLQHLGVVVWVGQAAWVRGQNAIGAALQTVISSGCNAVPS
jgi:hypothetical protein